MDQPDLMKMMTRSISNVFETAFFQPVGISVSAQGLSMDFFQEDFLVGASLDFSGGMAGRVSILAPSPWINQVTADFLGIDEEGVTAAQKEDSIKEAVNMIAGHMFSLFDRQGEIHLGIPQMIRPVPLSREAFEKIHGSVHWVMTEEERLAVVMSLDD